MNTAGQASVGSTGRAPREHFLPLRKAELFRLLLDQPELAGRDREQFDQFCRLLDAVMHHDFHEVFQCWKDDYAPFDPDSDTPSLEPTRDTQPLIESLFAKFTSLLERANYRRLSRADIERVLDISSGWGVRLDVDFDLFERLEVYVRGDHRERRTRRGWPAVFRELTLEIPVYQRLAVMFRLREHPRVPRHVDTTKIYIKLFKNIPHDDLEMMLPGSRVKMTKLDRARIFVPTLAGIVVTAAKLTFKGLALFAMGTIAGTLALLGMVAALIGYGVKSFFGFQRTKEKYQFNLTKNLYYQNLDNNAGVFYRLVDAAEEQDLREMVLAYYLLWRQAPADGWTQAELDRGAESFLRHAANIDADFEVDDAVQKLMGLGLVEGDAGRLRATPIGQAMRQLDRRWDDYFQVGGTSPAVLPAPHAKGLVGSRKPTLPA